MIDMKKREWLKIGAVWMIVAVVTIGLLMFQRSAESGPMVSGGKISPKIDLQAVAGLLGVPDSLAYIVATIENHNHSARVFYGKSAGDPYLDPDVLTEWQIQAKSAGYTGTAIQISNGDELDCVFYDLNRILVTATSAANKVQKIQFLYGTGAVGDATVATEVAMYVPASGKSESMVVNMPRIPCGSKVWALAFSETDNATIDFIVGIHEYDG